MSPFSICASGGKNTNKYGSFSNELRVDNIKLIMSAELFWLLSYMRKDNKRKKRYQTKKKNTLRANERRNSLQVSSRQLFALHQTGTVLLTHLIYSCSDKSHSRGKYHLVYIYVMHQVGWIIFYFCCFSGCLCIFYSYFTSQKRKKLVKLICGLIWSCNISNKWLFTTLESIYSMTELHFG